jgi:hypothetical protein
VLDEEIRERAGAPQPLPGVKPGFQHILLPIALAQSPSATMAPLLAAHGRIDRSAFARRKSGSGSAVTLFALKPCVTSSSCRGSPPFVLPASPRT